VTFRNKKKEKELEFYARLRALLQTKLPDVATPRDANAGNTAPNSETPKAGATKAELVVPVVANWWVWRLTRQFPRFEL